MYAVAARHWATCDNDITISQIVRNNVSFCSEDNSMIRDEQVQVMENSFMNQISRTQRQRDSTATICNDTCHQLIATCAFCGLHEIIM